MGVGPRGSPRRLLIDERRLYLGPAQRKQHAQQRLWLLLMAGLHLQVDVPLLLQELKLLPALLDELVQLIGGLLVHLLISVQADERQESIPLGDGQLAAALLVVFRAEPGVKGAELQELILRPFLPGLLAHDLLQLRKTPLSGEPDIVDGRGLVEVQEFEVDPVLLFVRALGHDTDHIAQNRHRAKILHDADPLVALLHIEPVHVLVDLDGILDALVLLIFAEVRPFGGKLGAVPQDGHEVSRKGIAPPHRLRPHDALNRNLYRA